jgi:predicted N-acyltransferase
MTELASKLQVSSLHITFPSGAEWDKLKEKGFSQRIGMQYHWKNRDYKNFDEFLMDMKQSKRKNIRQERKKVCLVSSFHIILIVQFILVS